MTMSNNLVRRTFLRHTAASMGLAALVFMEVS